ncbi:ABC-type lipoprotein export system, ATPase component [Desulfonatronum thiosulfatophilum]|uniref:ABC-type lipoprotein export system, ATPase component n=1 Tax=Desulfonatronum thiosulfatophilum TaxID=617002 RepID=A0A1G6DXN1_9BACT|nr:ABC transporter ATP-binding protein [Desulfonatronum thiosulfatophilum]SDB49906.1 ABC-type lipoprotein export system, ATPase component [Desulfonatronum thiosulfatophilum]
MSPKKAAPSDSRLVLENLRIATPEGRVLLENGNFTMAAGELLLLIGPSGGGKSTIVNVLSGLLGSEGAAWQIRGSLTLNEKYYDLADDVCDAGGLVFQDNALFDDLTAAQNLAIVMDHAGSPTPELARLIESLLRDVDPNQSVASLSGGQRQRVAIARTVLARRPILLFDEPNSGLDPHAAQRLAELIKELCIKMGTPAMIVAHHYDDLLEMADRVLILDPVQRTLHQTPPERETIAARLNAIGAVAEERAQDEIPGVPSRAWEKRLRERPPILWFFHYLWEYFWVLTASPLTIAYVLGGAAIVSFVTMWFGFNYDMLGDYMRSFVHDDALLGVGFIIMTIAVPLIGCILIVARNNAIITADIGNRLYSAQFRAMHNLHIPGRKYLNTAIVLNMVVGSLLLILLSSGVATWFALQTWRLIFPGQPFELWREHFFRLFVMRPDIFWENAGWVVLKTVISTFLASLVAIHSGMGRKNSVIDINNAIARSIVYGTSVTLLVHASIAVLQF